MRFSLKVSGRTNHLFYGYRFAQLVLPEDNVNIENCLDCTIAANVLSSPVVCQKAKCWYYRW